MAAYELGPEGATFDPPLTLTLKYGTLPVGADKKSIGILYWNGEIWQSLPGEIDAANRIVTTNVSHFSTFAVMAGNVAPARVSISD
jgi:hypothetical protein